MPNYKTAGDSDQMEKKKHGDLQTFIYANIPIDFRQTAHKNKTGLCSTGLFLASGNL